MESIDVLTIIVGVLLIAGVSKRIRETFLTLPLLCMLFGLFIGLFFGDFVALTYESPLVEIIATITLVFLVSTDASRITLNSLFRFHTLPMRLLLIGLPLTMALGAFLANAMFEDLMFWGAAVLAVSLAPTDTSPAENSVENPSVPVRIRQALDIEGGLNDGITLPFLMLTVALAVSATTGIGHGEVVLFGIKKIGFGVLVGATIGYLGAKYIKWGRQSDWMSSQFQKISWVALVVLSYGAAELIAGNGVIAAFSFGMTSGNTMGQLEEDRLHKYAEVENSLLMLVTYVIFGMVMLPAALDRITLPVVLYAVLSLTLVRMLPVAISMIGTKLRPVSVLYMGWFGPRGIATVLYILIVIGREEIAGKDTIYDIAILTVALSLILHGITAWPLSERYGKRIADLDKIGEADAEMMSVPELPTRAGRRQADVLVENMN